MDRQQLIEQINVESETDGSIEVHIPPSCLWECVECFCENRLNASYTYRPPHFVAHVGATTSRRVQDTLRSWRLPECSKS